MLTNAPSWFAVGGSKKVRWKRDFGVASAAQFAQISGITSNPSIKAGLLINQNVIKSSVLTNQ